MCKKNLLKKTKARKVGTGIQKDYRECIEYPVFSSATEAQVQISMCRH